MRAAFPMQPDARSSCGRAILDAAPSQIADVQDAIPSTRPRGRCGAVGLSQHCCRSAAARRRAIGTITVTPARCRAVHRQADRAAADLRRPGGDRDRERAPVQRDQGGARAADRDGRDPAGDQQLAVRLAAGIRRDRRARAGALRRAHRRHLALRRRADPHGRLPRRLARGDGADARPPSRAARTRRSLARTVIERRAGPHPRHPHRPGVHPEGGARASAGYRGSLWRADDARRRGHRRDRRLPRSEPGLFADKQIAAAQDLRRPGGDRDRERAPVQRDQGGARAADSDGRDPARSSASSPTDVQPVFDAIAERARVCAARAWAYDRASTAS